MRQDWGKIEANRRHLRNIHGMRARQCIASGLMEREKQ